MRDDRTGRVGGSLTGGGPKLPEHLEQAFQLGVQKNASDIHIAPGRPTMLRIRGQLVEFGKPWTDGDTEAAAEILTGLRPDEKQAEDALTFRDRRLRLSSFRNRNGVSTAVRFLPGAPPKLDTLGLPKDIMNLTALSAGLVLLVGPTGSGKSTTIASLIDVVNHHTNKHIITIEDPVEYIHPPGAGLVQQREVGRDCEDFTLGLRSALRQDPDVIQLGEMRDLETISIALAAAETGHLVFSTVHGQDCESAIQRITDVFESGRQQQTRIMLAASLSAVITQRLLPGLRSDQRVVVCEIVNLNTAMRACIRENNLHQLHSLIQGSVKNGSQPWELGLARAVNAGILHREVAYQAAKDIEGFNRYLRTGE